MKSLFKKLCEVSIAKRIFWLFSINVLALVSVTLLSIYYFEKIGHEIHQIAVEDVPLTRELVHLDTLQLEQSVYYEKVVRYVELEVLGQKKTGYHKKYLDKFLDHSQKVRDEHSNIVGHLDGILSIEHSADVTAKFEQLRDALGAIGPKLPEIDEAAIQSVDAVLSGNIDYAESLIENVETLEEAVHKDIHDLVIDIEEFTEKSILLTEEHERTGEYQLIAVSVLLLLISLGSSFAIVRSVNRPIDSFKASMIELGDGFKPDVPDYSSHSEIGMLFDSMAKTSSNLDAINSMLASFQFSTDGEVTIANERFLDIMGSGADMVIGCNLDDLINGDKNPSDFADSVWRTLRSGQSYTGEFAINDRKGHQTWFDGTICPILSSTGEVTRYVVYGNDVTDMVDKRLESEMVSLVAAHTDNLVVITDANEKIEYVNNGFTRLTGYSFEEAVGKKPGKLLQGHDTDPAVVQQIREKIVKQEPFYDEILNYTSEGEPYWISLAINPVFDENNNLKRFVSIQGVVTDNKLRAIENENGMNESVDVLTRMASGDLDCSMTGEYSGTFEKIKDAVNQVSSQLQSTVINIRDSVDEISTAADEISTGNNNLSSRTEQQAASLEKTASSMEQLTSTVRHNANNAQQANQLATGARQTAEKGGEVVGRAVTAMSEINEASNKIAEIIGVIDEIAFQTNLLALNASVEAARAGEQGRGFAVVATEVRNLAQRSATSAREIKELIQDSVEKVDAGAALVNESGMTLEEIVNAVKKVGDIVAEIAAASQEQASGIDQVNQTVTSMDEMTQQNAALAEETSAASVSMNQQAREMSEQVAFFRVGSQGGSRVGSSAVSASTPAKTPSSSAVPSSDNWSAPSATGQSSSEDEWAEF
ncbi:MAG: methyl-accepting chemotaxis protein [Pseudomonadota bacterium]